MCVRTPAQTHGNVLSGTHPGFNKYIARTRTYVPPYLHAYIHTVPTYIRTYIHTWHVEIEIEIEIEIERERA